MQRVDNLSEKLDMLLKACSLSRVSLAQQVGVDKSLVGRWVNGSVHPGEHNLARLTGVFRKHFPNITLADLYDDKSALADRMGISHRTGVPTSSEYLPDGPFAKIIAAAGPDIEFFSETYQGFWRSTRSSILMPEDLFHDYGILRLKKNGMMEVLMEGAGLKFEGWMFPMAGNVYAFMFDGVGRTPLIALMKGVALPRAMSLEGVLLASALDPGRTPVVLPVVLERIEDLDGDEEVDNARLQEIIQTKPDPIDPISDEERQSFAFRDTGPIAAEAGGERLLSIKGRLSRGVTSSGLRG